MAAARARDDSILVELGSFFGESTVYMGQLLRAADSQAKFFAIDLWCWEEWMDDTSIYQSAAKSAEHAAVKATYGPDPQRIISHYLERYNLLDRVSLLKEDSIEAASRFEDGSVDFLYVDTEHTYTRVNRELDAWADKVKKGGLIAGDDFGRDDDGDGGVGRAVTEHSGGEYFTDGTTWYYEKVSSAGED